MTDYSDHTLQEQITASGAAFQDHIDNHPSGSGEVTLEQLTTTSGDIVDQIPTDYVTSSQLTTTSGDIVDQIPSLSGYATEAYVDNAVSTISGGGATSSGCDCDATQVEFYIEPGGYYLGDGTTNSGTEDATPAMTSSNTPAPYEVTADVTYSSYYPWEAFANDGGNYWMGTNDTSDHWIKFNFGASGVVINKYRWRTADHGNAGDRSPKDWELQGSYNDSDWTTLHSASGISYYGQDTWGPWYGFDNVGVYNYYRMYITDTLTTNNTYVQIGEIEFIEAELHVPAPRYFLQEGDLTSVSGALVALDYALNTVSGDLTAQHETAQIEFININSDGATVTGTGYATPAMTSNTIPEPYAVSADQTYSTDYPWRAFDQSSAGSSHWMSGSSVLPHWLQFYFGEGNGKVINKYRLFSGDNSFSDDRFPNAWKIQGSHDGSDWVDLDDETLETYQGNETWTEWYTFENTIPYTYYRLYITSDFNSTNYTEVAEVQFVEAEPYNDFN